MIRKNLKLPMDYKTRIHSIEVDLIQHSQCEMLRRGETRNLQKHEWDNQHCKLDFSSKHSTFTTRWQQHH